MSDCVQCWFGKFQLRGKLLVGVILFVNLWVVLNLLLKLVDDVYDFNGVNMLYLWCVIDFGQVGLEYFIYVYGMEGVLIDILYQFDGFFVICDGML